MSKTVGKYRLKEAVVDGLASADIITALGYTPENTANKKTDLTADSETYIPSQSAVNDALALKADTSVMYNFITMETTDVLLTEAEYLLEL